MSQISEVRSSSESSINFPEKTNDWTSEEVCNRLQITLRSQDDPRSLFIIGYHRLLGQNVEHKNYMRTHFETPDHEYLVKQICLEFALESWKDMVNGELIGNIRVEDAIKMNQALSKPFSSSAFNDFLESDKTNNWMCKEPISLNETISFEEKKEMLRENCQKIYAKLKVFSDQLLYVLGHKNNPSERMFQQLFMAFVRIFDLTIFDTTNSPNSCYCLYHGHNVVMSEPAAVISSYKLSPEMELESKVIAVVEVKKDYSKPMLHVGDDAPANKKIKVESTLQNVAEHLDSRVKGKHIGDMLAVTQSSSLFGLNGIFGFIVQGTKVTVVSLETSKQYFDNLVINEKTMNLRPEVSYSREYNILSKDGRQELIPVLLGMEKLLHL